MFHRIARYVLTELADARTAIEMREWLYVLPSPLFRLVTRSR
jgi:hypothetical protein